MARAVWRGHMVAAAFIQQRVAVVVKASGLRPRPHGDVGHISEGGGLSRNPVGAVRAIDLRVGLGQQTPAKLRRLFDQQHLRARLASRAGGGEAGHAAADHQYIGVVVVMFVSVRIGLFRRGAETGGLADHRFEHMFPRHAWEHEGLVVEPGGEDRRDGGDGGVHRADVKIQRRPVVLRLRSQAVIKLLHCGALVRLRPVSGADGHQGVGFFDTRRDHTARAVIFERPAHQRLAARQKGGGQRIPGETRHGLAVKLVGHRFRAVDQTAAVIEAMGHLRRLPAFWLCP